MPEPLHTCTELAAAALHSSQPVTYLTAKLAELGSAVSIKCVERGDMEFGSAANAGYQLRDRSGTIRRGDIVIPAEPLYTPSQFERLVTHELIHQYDDARANVQSENCLHHACSEIRAARLSGDCRWDVEWGRSNWLLDFTMKGKRCVERRARQAVDLNPNCGGRAGSFVAEVWEPCYHDPEPFTRPPYG
eukprot:GGOE01036497.1.p1 GENE.GGOE01036497.1~~GGOE01036497.1.p1  ORF type:complete len:190 (+),score=42.29 GGOE01036497.1:71-640(+)